MYFTVTEESGMEVSFAIANLVFSLDNMELYFEGTGSDGYCVLMIGDVKLRAKYWSTPEGYEIADPSTGKVYTVLDCMDAFKDFATAAFTSQTFDCWG